MNLRGHRALAETYSEKPACILSDHDLLTYHNIHSCYERYRIHSPYSGRFHLFYYWLFSNTNQNRKKPLKRVI